MKYSRKKQEKHNSTHTRKSISTYKKYKKYEILSPFELKNKLITLAKKSKNKEFLNAGRGNPNFFNVFVRRVFGLLHNACLEISNETSNHSIDTKTYMSYDPSIDFKKKLLKKVRHLMNYTEFGSDRHYSFIVDFLKYLESNELIHDFILSLNGCFYPSPPQIQSSLLKIVKEFMFRMIFEHQHTNETPENFEYFVTEGAAAGILYTFNSLSINGLLNPKDKIAIITPIFSPYLEMPRLKQYGLNVVELKGDPNKEYSLSNTEMDKLKDTSIKALFMVNPANPSEYSLPKQNIDYIGSIVETHRKDLIVVSDSVYAPFVNEFKSFMYSCPKNTIEIYSLSKFFGVTGWRLGIVMMRKNNNLNTLLDTLPKYKKKELHKRYEIASIYPDKLTLMERIVMDSRQVAEAHTGGLSTPQQAMMGLMLYYSLHDYHKEYKRDLQELLQTRMELVYDTLGYMPVLDDKASNYYSLIDILQSVELLFGKRGVQKIKKVHYIQFLFHLAKQYGVVLLPGKGFGSTEWRIRISLANLETSEYKKIGNYVYQCLRDFCC